MKSVLAYHQSALIIARLVCTLLILFLERHQKRIPGVTSLQLRYINSAVLLSLAVATPDGLV